MRSGYKYLLLSSLFIFFINFSKASAQLQINEIMASNAHVLYDKDYYNFPDWIELHNIGTETINAFYYLSDDKTDLLKWSFTASIGPDEYFIIYCDNESGNKHASFELDNNGEALYLSKSDGTIVDSLQFGQQYTDVSFGRSASTGQWHYCARPTPGSDNLTTSATRPAFKPYFLLPTDFYGFGEKVNIYSGLDQATIRFSTDGSEPGRNHPQYTGPIELDKTTVIKAKAKADGWLPSETVASTYFVNEPSCALPIVSLSMNSEYLWDDQIGIYVAGTNGIPGNCAEEPLNWNQNWERAAYFEYIDEHGVKQISQPAGVKVSGGCTRLSEQKSLSIYARGKYGDNDFDYAFFKSKPNQDEYRSLFLRNSGNDWNYTMFRDAAIQGMAVGGMDIDHQSYQPVRVYINGEFFGLMNIREKLDEDYFFSNYQLEDDTIDFLEGNYQNSSESVIRGSNADFKTMVNFADQQDLSVESNYEQVVKQIDLEEYINYMVLQIYVANTDWPGNNIKYWRPHNGKWRWIMYDTDFGFSLYEDLSNHQTLHFATETNGPSWPNPPWSTLFFRSLLENESFRKQFSQTLLTHMNTTFHPDRFDYIVDSMAATIADEMVLFKQLYDGNIQDWEWQVERLKEASHARANFMPAYVESFFNLQNKIPLTIEHEHKTKGNVKVNNVYLTHSPLSMNSYEGLPYTIEAIPASGYEFDHWLTTGTRSIKDFITTGSIWKYNDSIDAYPVNWTELSFNDAAWDTGYAQLGYGDGDENTILSFGDDANNKRPTYLFRKSFSGIDTNNLQEITMNVLVDDGAVVYLNGEEIVRINMPEGDIQVHTYASNAIANENGFTSYKIPKDHFNNDTNIISIEIHQVGGNSSDISFDMDLTGYYYHPVEEQIYSTSRKLEGEMEETIAIRPVFKNAQPTEGLVINEIATASRYLYDNLNQKSDFIEIYNTSNQEIDLGGMYLTDDIENPGKYMVTNDNPDLTTIPADGFLVLYADGNPKEGLLHTNFSLDEGGEFIGLYQKIGTEFQPLDSLTYHYLQTNYSYGRYTDGADEWHHMPLITAGAPNSLEQPAITESIHSDADNEVLIYPNPAGDQVNIRMANKQLIQSTTLHLEIYNVQGKRVYPVIWINQAEFNLNLSGLDSGLYLLRFLGEDGRYIDTRKLVIAE